MTNQTMTEQSTVYYERTYKNTTPRRVMAALRRTKALGEYRVDIERAGSTVEAADSDARLHSGQSTRSFEVCTTDSTTRIFEVVADAHDITCRIVETATEMLPTEGTTSDPNAPVEITVLRPDEPSDAKRDFGGTKIDYAAVVARREAAQAERDRIGAQPVTPDMTEAEVADRNNAFNKAQEAFMQACNDETAAMSAALEAERESRSEAKNGIVLEGAALTADQNMDAEEADDADGEDLDLAAQAFYENENTAGIAEQCLVVPAYENGERIQGTFFLNPADGPNIAKARIERNIEGNPVVRVEPANGAAWWIAEKAVSEAEAVPTVTDIIAIAEPLTEEQAAQFAKMTAGLAETLRDLGVQDVRQGLHRRLHRGCAPGSSATRPA